LIEKRLKDRYKGRAKFEVHGTPKDLDHHLSKLCWFKREWCIRTAKLTI
jgi:hypothetical protein